LKKVLSIIIIVLMFVSGCSKLKKPAGSSGVQANPSVTPSAQVSPSDTAGNSNSQEAKADEGVKVPVVPEGVDPELWMGEYGSLEIDDSDTGIIYLVDKGNNKITISKKVSSPLGFIFKVSPDRTSLVYVEMEGEDKYNVVIYNAKDKKSIKLLSAVTSTPQYIYWSPNGKFLIVNDINYKNGDLAKTTFNCTIYDASTGAAAAKLPGVEANWSPDSSNVVFTKVPDKLAQHMYQSEEVLLTLSNEIGIYNIETGKTKYYTLDGDNLVFSVPEYSGDGEKIVFISSKPGSDSTELPASIYDLVNDSIYIYDIKSGTAKKVVDNEFINLNNPESGYGYVKMNGNLLAYGGSMKDSVRVMSLKDGKTKTYTGLGEPLDYSVDSFMWTDNGSLKIMLSGDKSVTVSQDLEEK
jgi:hypothetical protein